MQIRYIDENGKTIKTQNRTRGRLPKGAIKIAEGVYTAPAKDDSEPFKPEYITVDSNAKIVSRTPKGRGRTAKGFTLMKDGDLAGHYIMVVSDTTTVVEKTKNA